MLLVVVVVVVCTSTSSGAVASINICFLHRAFQKIAQRSAAGCILCSLNICRVNKNFEKQVDQLNSLLICSGEICN